MYCDVPEDNNILTLEMEVFVHTMKTRAAILRTPSDVGYPQNVMRCESVHKNIQRQMVPSELVLGTFLRFALLGHDTFVFCYYLRTPDDVRQKI